MTQKSNVPRYFSGMPIKSQAFKEREKAKPAPKPVIVQGGIIITVPYK